MNVFLSATSVGLLLALLALGVAISYSVLRTIDLTVDGSFMTGAAIAGMLLIRGVPASLATLGGALGGVGCGLVTGIFQTKFGVPHLLAGMITTTGLYSVNLAIMGGGNLPLAAPVTVFEAVAGSAPMVTAELATAGVLLLLAGMLVVLLRWFFRSSLGLALLAVGDNPTMAEAVAVDTAGMTILGLGISNGLVALSGALFAQYQGFVNIQMGIGMLVAGLASVVLGESLLRARGIGMRLAAAVVGALIARYVVAGALIAGLDASALKLLSAALLLVVLVVPNRLRRLLEGRHRG